MSTFLRKVVFGLIGLLAGLAAWPLAEGILSLQTLFPSYLIFCSLLGAVLGATMGGFFGATQAITLSFRSKVLGGVLRGSLVGLIGGALGFSAGQGALFLSGDLIFYSNKMMQSVGIPISRSIGWGVLGIFIGSIEGVRSLSGVKLKVGVLGGLIGGLLGGLVLEYSRLYLPNLMFARLLGLLTLGLLIGVFYSFFEKHFAQGVFKLLNGKLKGKEYLIIQKRTRIGKSSLADIQLNEYTNIGDMHAEISINGGNLIIKIQDAKTPVIVNEHHIQEHILKFDDVVQIGNAKFLFLFK